MSTSKNLDSIWNHSLDAPTMLCFADGVGNHYSRQDLVDRISYDSRKLLNLDLHKEKGIAVFAENALSSITIPIAAFQLGLHVLLLDGSGIGSRLENVVALSGVTSIIGTKATLEIIKRSPKRLYSWKLIEYWSAPKAMRARNKTADLDIPLAAQSGKLITPKNVLNSRPGFILPPKLNLDRHEYASTYVGIQLTKGILPESRNVQVVHHNLARPEVFFWALATIHSGNILVTIDTTTKPIADTYKRLYTAYLASGKR